MRKTLLLVFFSLLTSLSFAQSLDSQIEINDTCYEIEHEYRNTDTAEFIEISLSIDSIRLGRYLYTPAIDTVISLGPCPKTIHIQDDIYMRFRKVIIVEEGIAINHLRYSVYRVNRDCLETTISSAYEVFSQDKGFYQVTVGSADKLYDFEGYYWEIRRR